jgi:hypothetical protein
MFALIRVLFCCAPSSSLPFWAKRPYDTATNDDVLRSIMLIAFILHVALIAWSLPTLVADWTVATCTSVASEDDEPRNAHYSVHIWLICSMIFFLYAPWGAINYHHAISENKPADATCRVRTMQIGFVFIAIALMAWGLYNVFLPPCKDFEQTSLFKPSAANVFALFIDTVVGITTIFV